MYFYFHFTGTGDRAAGKLHLNWCTGSQTFQFRGYDFLTEPPLVLGGCVDRTAAESGWEFCQEPRTTVCITQHVVANCTVHLTRRVTSGSVVIIIIRLMTPTYLHTYLMTSKYRVSPAFLSRIISTTHRRDWQWLRWRNRYTLCPKKTVVPNFGDNFVKS